MTAAGPFGLPCCGALSILARRTRPGRPIPPAHARTVSMAKIKVAQPVVELDGDEMTGSSGA